MQNQNVRKANRESRDSQVQPLTPNTRFQFTTGTRSMRPSRNT